MNKAIAQRKSWKLDNTRVEYDSKKSISQVYLHNNKIAEIGENFVTVFHCGWKTNVTKSRLNAILRMNGKGNEGIYQKDFVWFISYDDKVEEFNSPVTLM